MKEEKTKKKFNKKKVITPLMVILGIGLVMAGAYYVMFSDTFNITEAFTLSGEVSQVFPDGVTSSVPMVIFGATRTIKSNANDERTVTITHNNLDGVSVNYWTYLAPYSFTDSQDVNGGTVGQLEVTVAEDGEWMVWTFDFPVEQFTGDGNLNVGLIIATDGEGNGPAFQIHNTDSNDMTYDGSESVPAGTWVMSPWGPTIIDGWLGWHSGDTNTLVTDLSWVEATGNRNVPHNGGVMEIRIKKSELGNNFHWAASPTVGSGFYAPASDVTMQLPADFGWGTPLVDMTTPNYVYAELMEELDDSFPMAGGSSLDIIPVYTIEPYTTVVGTITTEVI